MTKPKLPPTDGATARKTRRRPGLRLNVENRLAKVELELPDGRYLIVYSHGGNDA
jgi:hypothetical protein